ncbi:hypothetical protein VTN77DRAFT_9093 [Rasamsonia byssochlamydoides]|uniref:uncharacterized protein n=1 Tax=Rasamsonia byssochlamydoides TaxID=89139 RepID=UPI003742F7E3
MAEQTRHDVVNQTRSGGDPSPSDVPASKPDKESAGGDVGGISDNAVTAQGDSSTVGQHADEKNEKNDVSASPTEKNENEKPSGGPAADSSKQGPGAVATRALELNGVASGSDGGEDTGSLGGSESDTSRADSRHHTRTGSVKKPTTFKPVSFTKFSVPKAPGSAPPSKIGDKVTLSSSSSSASPQPSTRPRLVAKTTSGLRDSASKPITTGLKSAGTGPDPSQVWNKNRPVQPPPTKHLTDEELKQQYGIHMTSRIQEDGSGTEAKWADIDDDEDDWAPETIEWNDGTKITLTHTESVSASGQDAKGSKDVKDTPPPADQSTSRDTAKVLFSKSSTTVGPNATVLRLGANADKQQQQQAKASSSSSKVGNEKPTLTAKSPPVKSPWAPLPPVDKVSPVNPPVQAQPSMRFPQREQQGSDTARGSMPTREIAADDFNRSWRDSHTNGPRELYNSQSGRYEPVTDTRKGPSRNEPPMRTPSLLQRPTHNEQTGPAEPSPAFQTHRTSNQEGGHWTRRRASSNVSGGSGSYGRRMSLGRPDGLSKWNNIQRGSQANGMLEQSTSPSETSHSKEAAAREVSPNQQSTGPWQPRTSGNMIYAPPGSHAGAPHTAAPSNEQNGAQVPEEDPIAMQQRIMREKRLEARQRRLEQEQREEAERRERIRLKLEALGPLPPKDSTKEKSKTQDEPAATKPTTKEPTAPSSTSPAIQSPPKPPVPEPTGEPKQYGMMKVHHPESVKKLVATSERTSEKPSTSGASNRQVASPTRDVEADAAKPNGILQHEESSHNRNQDQHREQPALDDKGPQWRANLNNNQSSYSPWGPGSKLGSHTSPSANPWKPLSSDKTLGNGTFDRNLATFASRELPLRGHVGLSEPPPIGPISTNSDKIGGPQPFSGSRISQENQPSLATSLPSPEPKHAPYEPFNPIARPRPIGPPGSHSNHWQAEPRRPSETATTAWHNFHAVAAKKDAEDSERFHRELNAMRDEGPASLQVSFNETWRQVRTGDQAGQRQVIGVARANDAPGTLPPLHGFDAAVDGLPFAENHSRPFSNVTGRGSRFFPPTTDFKRVVSVDEGRARSPSPPPPEEISTHPAFTGDSQRPLVHLPTPKPVVKLPPKTNPPPSKPATFASMVAATPATPIRPPNPSAGATSWQDRINGLFGKAPTEKKNILAVASATKEPLDVQSHPSPAAVSFPQMTESDLQKDAGKVTSKEVEEEEEIFEDREAGSLPVVRVPNMAPPMAWRAALPPPPRLRPKILKPMQVHSIEPYVVGLFDKDASGNLQVLIHLPGSENTKSVTLPKKSGNHGSRQKGTSNFRARKHTKPRDASGGFNASQGSKRQGAHPKGNTSSSRGGFGQGSWGPRVPAGVAH